jgi:hypothetical protein
MSGPFLLALSCLIIAVIGAALVTVIPDRSQTTWFDGRDFY